MHKKLLSTGVALTSVALIAACSGDSALPTAPLDGAPMFNVISTSPGSVMVCPQGPVGTYTYSVSVTIPTNYTYLGNDYVWPAAAITAAEANNSLPLGATPSLDIPGGGAGNCYEVFSVDGSIEWPAPVGTGTIDPRRIVTVTQTSAPTDAVLDSILYSTDYDPGAEDVKYLPPTVSVEALTNAFHGSVISFWNSIHETPPPGVDPRTIGYWQAWSSCSKGNGNQDPVLDETLASFAGGGVLIGDLFVNTCAEAQSLLKKSDVVSGTNRASDAAYGLAAQLMAAVLNVQNGATTCSDATDAIDDAQDLLDDIGFTGTGEFLKTNSSDRTEALELASTLDSYNNGNLCP
ncbi:MAG TPA: hypothetical protein VFZ56_00460 [Gemmatimonadaceae bacterium]